MKSIKRDCMVSGIVWIIILLTLPYESKLKYIGYSFVGLIIVFITYKFKKMINRIEDVSK
ncbi:hypothetical protein JTT01_04685 [Clostridium botulinum]|nr:hypothetical protein CFSAN002367_20662 [Clostridium botulinum CFSAN002367]MBO0583357.1 hypothetical protein [Clostridium botulinum]MCS4463798.1 hypothetical protein [Clostridium botulinum]MCS4465776.1 hypothetical protein [Clostridium botulinum]MCS4468322.1 hypothetical protein [Clostridium botulinum]